MMTSALPILWTALITPLLTTNKVDWQGLEKLVTEQEKAGNGILLLGSTGEALNMTLDMKLDLLAWFNKRSLNTPFMVGVGGSNLPETLSWVDTLNQQSGIDAYLMVTPPYAKPGTQGQVAWFKALMDRAQKPCILYNVPSRSACALSRDALLTLRTHPQFIGIKESSGSLEEFRAYKTMLPAHTVYCGDDALMPEFAQAGAYGLISVASNAWPQATHRYTEKCLQQTIGDDHPWLEASQSMFTASNPVPVKKLLAQMGWIQNSLVLPPLSQEDLQDTQPLTDAHQAIERWMKES